jgi:hypothetical protein
VSRDLPVPLSKLARTWEILPKVSLREARVFSKLRATRLIATRLAKTVLAPGLNLGVSVACAQRQPETLSKTRASLADREIQKMVHGQVVTKVLESGEEMRGPGVWRREMGGVPKSYVIPVVMLHTRPRKILFIYCDNWNLIVTTISTAIGLSFK